MLPSRYHQLRLDAESAAVGSDLSVQEGQWLWNGGEGGGWIHHELAPIVGKFSEVRKCLYSPN